MQRQRCCQNIAKLQLEAAKYKAEGRLPSPLRPGGVSPELALLLLALPLMGEGGREMCLNGPSCPCLQVSMLAYAPLMGHVAMRTWEPNLIVFNESHW